MHLIERGIQTTRTDAKTLEKIRLEGKDFLLLFTASWCGYCATLKKELETTPTDFLIYEMDISDEACSAWDDYEVRVVPTVIFFKGGKEISRKAASFNGLKVKEIKSLSSSP